MADQDTSARVRQWAQAVRAARQESIAVKEAFSAELDLRVAQAADACKTRLEGGGRIFACGNGGSASDAQHFVAELVGRYLKERRALPALAFTANTSDLTAIGNDYGFDSVFERQVEAWMGKHDVLLGISTSGNSPNVLRAAQAARARGAFVLALTGRDGGKLAAVSDLEIRVPSKVTARIQESHILVLHCLAELIEAT